MPSIKNIYPQRMQYYLTNLLVFNTLIYYVYDVKEDILNLYNNNVW